ncbi:hypothetical protein [Bradyrhizobium sp. CCBAU 45384]|uniref:hypothetical protein n=1 Tax=Bradyrhizobium sp. CCBAU 45384 TaxID=858428 RepID=UPI002305B765|nr:hypothetical protein [Bradyrhizobium sp. CCBAU 45384]
MMVALDTSAGAVTRRPIITATMPLVVGGFVVLTILLFWPWLGHLSSALIGPEEDNMQDFWNSWHAATAHGWRDFLFTNQIRYPEGTSLSYHSFAWPQVAAVMLLGHIFGTSLTDLILFQNLTLLASFPLSAAAMFLLARHLLGERTGYNAGAALAGFVFAFNPWHVAQVMHHAHVATIEFLPLFVLFYLKALEERNYLHLAAASAMMALSALSCWYYLFYAFYFMAFDLVFRCSRDRKWPEKWQLAAPMLCVIGSILLLSPWLIPMIMARGPANAGTNAFVADLFALVVFPPSHFLARLGESIYARLTGNPWEATVYLGLANLAALAWAFACKTETDKRVMHYALVGMLFFLVLAAGETLHIGGHPSGLPLPYFVLAKLPFFGNVRTPARAIVMVYMFLGLGLAQACVIAARRIGIRQRACMAFAAIAILFDFFPTNLTATPIRCSPALAAIAGDSDRFGVLDLPRGYIAGNIAMALSACHGHPIVAGETSRKLGVTLADQLETGNLALQQRQLTAAHVKYIVLRRSKGRSFVWNETDGSVDDYLRTYPQVGSDDEAIVLRVY